VPAGWNDLPCTAVFPLRPRHSTRIPPCAAGARRIRIRAALMAVRHPRSKKSCAKKAACGFAQARVWADQAESVSRSAPSSNRTALGLWPRPRPLGEMSPQLLGRVPGPGLQLAGGSGCGQLVGRKRRRPENDRNRQVCSPPGHPCSTVPRPIGKGLPRIRTIWDVESLAFSPI